MAKTKQDYIEQGKRDYHAANTRNTYAMARVRHMKENFTPSVNLSWQAQAYLEGFTAARAADLEGATIPKPASQETADAERLAASDKWNKAWDEKAAQQAAEVAAIPKPAAIQKPAATPDVNVTITLPVDDQFCADIIMQAATLKQIVYG